ncbi:MAG: hypothetical protein Q8O86_00175 [Dehalococcoidia bacterium]|nr:hypothetical protein [Dehalococcoidia bacterium]
MNPKEQRMTDLEAQYPDQWVIIQVTGRDRYGRASQGIVIAHGGEGEKEGMAEKHIDFGKANPDAVTYLHWTGRLIPEGLGVIL